MKRTVAALTAVAGLAGFANAQFVEIVPSMSEVNVAEGPVTVDFSMYFDNDGLGEFDLGAAGVQTFFGWAGMNGVFTSTGGTFQVVAETDDDAAGGVIATPFGPATIDETNWFGRAPGIAAVNGSDGFIDGFGVVANIATGANGSGGSFRFGNVAPNYEVSGDGQTLSFLGGVGIQGAQSPTAVGGTNQDTSGRVEVFRGQISFDEGDVGMQDIDFEGLASFFIESGLTGFTSFGLDNAGGAVNVIIPTPASAVLLGLGGLAMRRRR